jgi:SAM-dependent methyltransferase
MASDTAAYFDRLARSWSRQYAPGGALRHRLERSVAPMLNQLRPGSRVLDFGCGTGEITRALQKAGFAACGFDISPGMLLVARTLSAGTGIVFAAGDPTGAFGIPLANGVFAGVLASSVLEYVPDPLSALSELARILEPAGVLVLTVPNPLHPKRKLERLLRSIAISPLSRWLAPLLNERGRAYQGYLSLSVNRPPLERWLQILGQAGMRVDHVSVDGRPLTVIVASKLDAASRADAGS